MFDQNELIPNFGNNYCFKIVCGAGNNARGGEGVIKHEVIHQMRELNKFCRFIKNKGSIYVLCKN